MAIVSGGLVVAPDRVREADVLVEGGRIAAVVAPGETGGALIDARGCVVLAGGVDPHTHLLSDIVPAAVSAAYGGTTTALSFTAPRPGETPQAAFVRARDEQVPLAAVDVGLHPSIWEPDRLTAGHLEELRDLGARSVKLYLAYPELGMMASDRTLYETLRAASRLGLLVQVHCENGGAIAARVAELLAAGRKDLPRSSRRDRRSSRRRRSRGRSRSRRSQARPSTSCTSRAPARSSRCGRRAVAARRSSRRRARTISFSTTVSTAGRTRSAS